MTTFMQTGNSKLWAARRKSQAGKQIHRSIKKSCAMQIYRTMFLLLAVAALITLPGMASSQSFALSGESSDPIAGTVYVRPDLTYEPPTEKTKLGNYMFDAFGPYPIAGAAFVAGINQISNEPPEWKQGAEGYGKRFGSDFGIAVVGTTTRYGLAEAFKVDTLYYRCACRGLFPRLRHAMVSAVTGRRGDDGHLVFSVPAVIAPYAGTMTAVYGWYPDRFGAKDAFRMGNYSLLAYAGQNISLEFFHSRPYSLLARMHLKNTHGANDPEPSR
jgi:hypothetical protein